MLLGKTGLDYAISCDCAGIDSKPLNWQTPIDHLAMGLSQG